MRPFFTPFLLYPFPHFLLTVILYLIIYFPDDDWLLSGSSLSVPMRSICLYLRDSFVFPIFFLTPQYIYFEFPRLFLCICIPLRLCSTRTRRRMSREKRLNIPLSCALFWTHWRSNPFAVYRRG